MSAHGGLHRNNSDRRSLLHHSHSGSELGSMRNKLGSSRNKVGSTRNKLGSTRTKLSGRYSTGSERSQGGSDLGSKRKKLSGRYSETGSGWSEDESEPGSVRSELSGGGSRDLNDSAAAKDACLTPRITPRLSRDDSLTESARSARSWKRRIDGAGGTCGISESDDEADDSSRSSLSSAPSLDLHAPPFSATDLLTPTASPTNAAIRGANRVELRSSYAPSHRHSASSVATRSGRVVNFLTGSSDLPHMHDADSTHADSVAGSVADSAGDSQLSGQFKRGRTSLVLMVPRTASAGEISTAHPWRHGARVNPTGNSTSPAPFAPTDTWNLLTMISSSMRRTRSKPGVLKWAKNLLTHGERGLAGISDSELGQWNTQLAPMAARSKLTSPVHHKLQPLDPSLIRGSTDGASPTASGFFARPLTRGAASDALSPPGSGFFAPLRTHRAASEVLSPPSSGFLGRPFSAPTSGFFAPVLQQPSQLRPRPEAVPLDTPEAAPLDTLNSLNSLDPALGEAGTSASKKSGDAKGSTSKKVDSTKKASSAKEANAEKANAKEANASSHTTPAYLGAGTAAAQHGSAGSPVPHVSASVCCNQNMLTGALSSALLDAASTPDLQCAPNLKGFPNARVENNPSTRAGSATSPFASAASVCLPEPSLMPLQHRATGSDLASASGGSFLTFSPSTAPPAPDSTSADTQSMSGAAQSTTAATGSALAATPAAAATGDTSESDSAVTPVRLLGTRAGLSTMPQGTDLDTSLSAMPQGADHDISLSANSSAMPQGTNLDTGLPTMPQGTELDTGISAMPQGTELDSDAAAAPVTKAAATARPRSALKRSTSESDSKGRCSVEPDPAARIKTTRTETGALDTNVMIFKG